VLCCICHKSCALLPLHHHDTGCRHAAHASLCSNSSNRHELELLTGSRISSPVVRSIRHGVAVFDDSQAKICMLLVWEIHS
jgi:hypothetical protein